MHCLICIKQCMKRSPASVHRLIESVARNCACLARVNEQVVIAQLKGTLERVGRNRGGNMNANAAPSLDAVAQDLLSIIGVEKPMGRKSGVGGCSVPIRRIPRKVLVIGIRVTEVHHCGLLIESDAPRNVFHIEPAGRPTGMGMRTASMNSPSIAIDTGGS